MTGPATLMEYGWSFLDARMSNPPDYEMMIGSDWVESGLVKDHPESNYRIEHDSLAKVVFSTTLDAVTTTELIKYFSKGIIYFLLLFLYSNTSRSL